MMQILILYAKSNEEKVRGEVIIMTSYQELKYYLSLLNQ